MTTDDPGTFDPHTFRHELRIEASPDVVFTYFTDPAKMARWMGIEHKLDPVPGGVFHVDVNGRDVAVGEYVEVDPPRRAVFTWGWQGNQHLPPGSTTVEVDLILGFKERVHERHLSKGEIVAGVWPRRRWLETIRAGGSSGTVRLYNPVAVSRHH